ncbi:hypothetical protein QMS86_14110 [Cronobacter dublinensis]|uniref:hypothetical protein n=1 Tax=Cronobacter dublinensis TaxID=413497 RepID=UPI003ADF3A2D
MCTVGPEYDVFRLYFLFSKENKVRSVFSENAGDTAQTFIPHPALMTSQARHNGRFGQRNARDILPRLLLWRYGEHPAAMLFLTPQQGERPC